MDLLLVFTTLSMASALVVGAALAALAIDSALVAFRAKTDFAPR
ncbi:MAG: hypothetical protein AAFZ06_01560 [Pseudomonadota bacterium]